MKPAVDRATTAKVLADIDSVLRERTAAAVERVLRTASPGHGPFPNREAHRLAYDLCGEVGTFPVSTNCLDHCGVPGVADFGGCATDGDYGVHATPGMTIAYNHRPEAMERRLSAQARDYAPWVVSPHLFTEVAS